ncbi:MAG TPA: hypothetical protein VG015_02850, partial [Candidatus Dormibacteraeota bacterium]|nr:hypothetical protein [Candidatus Dormibacteraeota bacterium]
MRKISWGRMMLDFLAAAGALGAAFWIRFHLVPHLLLVPEPPEVERYVTAAPIVALALVVVFGVMGVYRAQRGVQFVDEFFSVVGAMAVTGLVVFAVIALIRFEEPGGQIFSYSRATFVIWLLTATFLITVARYGVRR